MSTVKSLKTLLAVNIKQEQDDEVTDEDESEETDEDDDSSDSMELLSPSILNKDCLSNKNPKDEFLRLTSMVRRVYFSYLHKSIINNYNVCYTDKNKKNISRMDLKKFASRLELYAVTASLEASLYRQAMLKIISDVKSNTEIYKLHADLETFLDCPPKTADASIQTCLNVEQSDKSISCDRVDAETITQNLQDNLDKQVMDILGLNEENQDQPQEILRNDPNINDSTYDINASVKEIFGDLNDDQNPTLQEDESRDSLLQHMEDMFGESDDSNDIMALIEKHSGVSKSNLDMEISKMCPETPSAVKTTAVKILKRESSTSNTSETMKSGVKRKVSFSNYKKMKKMAIDSDDNVDLLQNRNEDKQMKKIRGIWFVERVHQVSKLQKKMMELSATNYRKHGRVRAKFHMLFGDSDEEEMMPESPIHIEEHLTACKERIAPWVVKYLMPYYTKKLIKDRLLFKAVAKHIADMLIIENTFPEEDCVCQYVQDYFRNKPCINAEADIYI